METFGTEHKKQIMQALQERGYQLAWLIRQQHRNRKNTIPKNQPLLYH